VQLLPPRRVLGNLDAYTWRRVTRWVRLRHDGITWAVLRRRYLNGWRPVEDGVQLFDTRTVTVTRYRYRRRTSPRRGRARRWRKPHSPFEWLAESRMRRDAHVRFGGRAGETDQLKG
jgi:hypothetical protein